MAPVSGGPMASSTGSEKRPCAEFGDGSKAVMVGHRRSHLPRARLSSRWKRTGVDAGAELLHLDGIEARESGDARRHALDRLGIAFAAHEIAQIIAGRIGLDFAQRIAVERRRASITVAAIDGSPRDPGQRIVTALAEIAEVSTGEIMMSPRTPTPCWPARARATLGTRNPP